MGNTSSTKTAPVPSPTIPPSLVGDLTAVSTHTLRRRSVSNLLRMGVRCQVIARQVAAKMERMIDSAVSRSVDGEGETA